MPLQCKKPGISFLYPDNWTIDEEHALAGKRSVTVSSPGGAFWSVSIHPRSRDPAVLARAVVDTMEGEYEGLESEKAEETVAGRQMHGYDLNFFFLDFTHTAIVRCVRTARATYAIFCQAEDHEYGEVERVFAAMTTSLLNGLDQDETPGEQRRRAPPGRGRSG